MFVVAALALATDIAVQLLLEWSDPASEPSFTNTPLISGVIVPVCLLLFAGRQRRVRAGSTHLTGAAGPAGMVLFITALNITTHDVSPGAQFFVLLPLLYAAYNLHLPAALLIGGLAVVCQILSTSLLLEPWRAFHDSLYGGIILISITVLVNRLRSSHDQARDELARIAQRDALTGLVTRTVMEEAAESVLATPQGAALILVDLDRFKQVNDSYGHPAGDEVLRVVADTITSSTRPGDVVARMGGDEMAALIPGCSLDAARERAGQVVSAIGSTRVNLTAHGGPATVTLSASVGVARSAGETTFSELYTEADRSLYTAKTAGRGRVGV